MASSGYSGASKRKRKRDKKKVPQFSSSHETSVSIVTDHVRAVANEEKLGAESGNRELEGGVPQVQEGFAVLEIRKMQTESHSRTREVPQNPLNCLPHSSSSELKSKPASESKINAKKSSLSTQNRTTAKTTPQSTVDVTNCSTFEQELYWCIGQLQLGLMRLNAKKHQKDENERYIKTLSSSKTLLPKKRQIMRNLFGDYRAKMKTNPLPDRLQSPKDPEISCVENDSLEVMGKFYKHSATLARLAMKSELEGDCSGRDRENLDRTTASGGFGSGGRGFQFNFDIENNSLES